MNSRTHALITAYMARHGFSSDNLRHDGRLTITVDEKYRIHMYPDVGGRVVFESRILPLPTDRNERSYKIDQVLQFATSQLQKYAAGCVIDRHEEALWLQQTVRANTSPSDFDQQLGQFVNALAVYIKAAVLK